MKIISVKHSSSKREITFENAGQCDIIIVCVALAPAFFREDAHKDIAAKPSEMTENEYNIKPVIGWMKLTGVKPLRRAVRKGVCVRDKME